ncbi:MAG: hypothetical protein HKO91_07545, partial [Desulfobacterales bacterium]|nr:hypothetical protein [Desulfobacterales bacterium]
LSYSRGVAYHAIIDVVKSNFEIVDDDDDFKITEKLKHGLKILEADESSTLPYLLELLSVMDSGVDPISLSPDARKDRIIETLNRITIMASQIQPVIMVIEDLHWIDKNSEDTLKVLLESISGERVFLIFTYRTEYIPAWGTKFYHSQVNLNRFSNHENLKMVTNLLGTEDIDRKLEKLILEKTEGVPFFIEEFIKSLRDLQIIERKKTKYHLTKDLQNVIIPSTIQDVIMARVDKLPEAAKELLQIGSVIEREFSYNLISHVAGLPEKELLSNLSILKSSEILFERGVYPETLYIFNHALSREVIYESVLSMKRRDLHKKIGNAIENLYKENLYKHYEVLAEHYRISEDYHKAAGYSELAAKKAIKTVSVNDAIVFGYKTINCLEKLPLSEEIERKIIIARNNLGLYCSQINRFPEAKEIIDPVVDLAIKYDMKKSVARMYNILASYYAFNEGDQIKGSEYFNKAIQLSEKINDFFAFSQANFWLGCALGLNCQFDQASQCFEQALGVSVAANSLWGISVTKSNWALFVFYLKGDPDKACEISKEAVSLAEENGDIFSKSWAYVAYGLSCFGKGLLSEAIKYNFKGIECCKRIDAQNNHSLAQECMAQIHFVKEEYQDSVYCFSQSVALVEESGTGSDWINCRKIGLAMAKVLNNERDIDLELLRDYAHSIKMKAYRAWAYRYMSHVMLNIDEYCLPEAEYWIKKAIDSDTHNSLMPYLGQDYALYAKWLNRKGDTSKAKESLGKAIEIFKDCCADGWVQKYKKELELI